MKKLIVHIGYPKTATSSLQLNVFTTLMKKGEIEYLNNLEKGSPDHGTFLTRRTIAYILGQDLNANWQEEVEKFSNITKEISVLSDETLSHSSEQYCTVASRSGAVRNAKKVQRIFTPYFDSIEILMTVREQSSMTLSQYTQEYYNLCNYNPDWTNFEVWFSDTFSKNTLSQGQFLDYHAMYMAYATCFGKENIHVIVYEDLLKDKNHFYHRLAQIFCVNSSEIKDLFESSIQNKTKQNKTS